ncbi:hypothetical protein BDV95DRAFT_271657 [Massariosphaeria phaeospora]|uniref:Uncharacterized protein n=1 Tax=Massariosphaeria phaeospora TaxID=100035 RepID=A0A7C8I0S2_9PLEO|nr:hypothetical protein BDV95DRAFT_271657 [Massariosphaeria phaeospora]
MDSTHSPLKNGRPMLMSRASSFTTASESFHAPPPPYKYTSHQESKTAYTGVKIHESTALSLVDSARGRTGLFIPRTTLLLMGPLLLTAGYAMIARFYLWEEAENDIVPYQPANARAVFYTWLIMSIFVLDWTKSALSGFEAAVLMRERISVDEVEERKRREQILAWHADHAWGSFSAWGKAVLTLGKHILKKARGDNEVKWDGPGLLWWYLALMVFLFTALIPLSGLSMNPVEVLVPSRRPVLVMGPNETTFDILTSNEAAEQASNRWRTRTVTTPDEPTIFYAPQEAANVSTTWFEDQIQADFVSRMSVPIANRSRMTNQTVTFFSGPRVVERLHGRAWGLLATLSCMPVHPYKDLHLLNVTGKANWTSLTSIMTSEDFATSSAQFGEGLFPVHSKGGETFGVQWNYIIATDGYVEGVKADYGNASALPLKGKVEVVLWQGYTNESMPDQTFREMSKHPFVVNSNTSSPSTTPFLGFGVRCDITSSAGTALLSGSKRTYSNFQKLPSKLAYNAAGVSSQLLEWPGILSLQSLVFEAFTTLTPGFMSPPKCKLPSISCNPWMGANRATGGVPVFNPRQNLSPNSSIGGTMQYPTIDPERMSLAMYKLFGETAIVVMASTPDNWISTPNSSAGDPGLGLFGFERADDLTPGSVPPTFILVMLCLWSLAVVIPPIAIGMLWKKREVEVVDGNLLWKFGIERGQEISSSLT